MAPTGPNGTHPLLFDWISTYFRTGRALELDKADPLTLSKCANKDMPVTGSMAEELPSIVKAVTLTSNFPPLFLQYQGWSNSYFCVCNNVQEMSKTPN